MDQKTRETILERDKECQLSKLFGIAELTGVPCSKDLEVHHKTYERKSHERVDDGITVCSRCHEELTDLIRRRRMGAQLEPEDVKRILPKREESNGIRNHKIQNYRSRTADYAQRGAERSS